MTNIFVGNLDFGITEHQLRELFAAHGVVNAVSIVTDRDTGQPRGFGFVEMEFAHDAEQAIRSLDGSLLNQRALRVNEARPKSEEKRQSGAPRGRDHRRHRI
jgi:cold-inducible RNA-binding protein